MIEWQTKDDEKRTKTNVFSTMKFSNLLHKTV